MVCLNENSEENILSYDVYRSDYAWILERIWKTEMNTGYYRKAEDMDPDQWNALEVYSNRKGTIVCARYENALLFFCADTSPTAYQKEVIVEKLNLQETVG